MRIKKNNTPEEIIEISKTFDNIAARNLETENLKDGDSVKVLDASDDPAISSGWAIYRFSKESGVFDLVEQETKDKIPETLEIDNNTIVENQDKKIVSFHSLNHGVGFEFPEAINMVFEPSGDSKSFNIIWSGMKNGVDTFGYKGHNYPLGIATKQVYSLQAKDNIDTYGFTHYVRISCHAGVVYWSSHVDYLTDIPSLELFNYNGKQFLPLAFIKLVYNPDYTMKYEDCQVSHIYKNSVLVASPEEAVPTVKIDNKTIIENPAKELVSFHNFNHGAGFEFPSDIDIILDDSAYTDLKIEWNGLRGDLDFFKYAGNEYKLGLNALTFTTEYLSSFLADDNFLYIKISHLLGHDSLDLDTAISSTLPNNEWVIKDGRRFLPIAIIKLCFEDDRMTVNLPNTQISRIFKNGSLINGEGSVDLGIVTVATNSGLNSTLRKTLYNGQLIKVLNAVQDPNLKGGWAVYRFSSENQNFDIVGQETYASSKAYSTIADRDILAPNACIDNEIFKVIDASGDENIGSGWAFYRFRKGSQSFELISKEEAPAPPAAETPTLDEVVKKGGETVEKITIKRDSTNTTALEVLDQSDRKKIGLHMLGEAGQMEIYNKLNQIGLSFDGEGNITALRRIKAKALAMTTNALKGRVATCLDGEGNFEWKDPTYHNYPDGRSVDYKAASSGQYEFSVPDAIIGFRSDMRLLKDFDFNVSIDYKTVKLDLVGASTQNIPVMTKDGQHNLQLNQLYLEMDSVNRGKTIYIPVCKQVHPTITGDAYYLGNASSRNGVQVFSDGSTDQTQQVMQLRITVPLDWNDFSNSDITVYKYWKKALGTFDELMDYRIANP